MDGKVHSHPRIPKKLKKPNTKKTSNPIKDWDTKLSKEFLKEDIQMAEKYLFYCLTSLDIPEMQIKTTLRFRLIPARIAKVNNK